MSFCVFLDIEPTRSHLQSRPCTARPYQRNHLSARTVYQRHLSARDISETIRGLSNPKKLKTVKTKRHGHGGIGPKGPLLRTVGRTGPGREKKSPEGLFLLRLVEDGHDGRSPPDNAVPHEVRVESVTKGHLLLELDVTPRVPVAELSDIHDDGVRKVA